MTVAEKNETRKLELAREALEKVEASGPVSRIRALAPQVIDRYADHMTRIAEIENDAGLNAAGKRERTGAARVRLTGDLDAFDDKFAAHVDTLRKAFVRGRPTFAPVDSSEASRIMISVARSPNISPDELHRELETALHGEDLALIAALAPILSSRLERGDGYDRNEIIIDEQPTTIQRGQLLLSQIQGSLLTLDQAASEAAVDQIERFRSDWVGLVSSVAGESWGEGAELTVTVNPF